MRLIPGSVRCRKNFCTLSTRCKGHIWCDKCLKHARSGKTFFARASLEMQFAVCARNDEPHLMSSFIVSCHNKEDFADFYGSAFLSFKTRYRTRTKHFIKIISPIFRCNCLWFPFCPNGWLFGWLVGSLVRRSKGSDFGAKSSSPGSTP